MQNRIKTIRNYYKMTQTQFGARIGLKGNTITSYETGLRTPTDAVIMSICREFNINRVWLETGEGDMLIETQSRTLDRIAARYGASEMFRTMLDVYAQLTDAQQTAFEEYARMLANAIISGKNPVSVVPPMPTVRELEEASIQEEALPNDKALSG